MKFGKFKQRIKKVGWKLELVFFILIESLLIFLILPLFSSPVFGGVGGNVTVITYLEVGNTWPELLSVHINYGDNVTLSPNSTQLVTCIAVVRDYNNDTDLNSGWGRFFATSSSYGDSDDNNFHYTNDSCNITRNFTSFMGYTDDEFLALLNCTFPVQYYANSTDWNCTVWINDTQNWNATGSNISFVDELLAVGLPDTINYGTVNATYVSDENITSVINYGNVDIDLDLSGYARTEGDGYAMNCTYGNVQNISIFWEKYNVTESHPGTLTLSQFEANYTNLTSSPVTEQFDLAFRQNDTENEALNDTYWRIYVPIGVAGSCSGNIVFGAVKS
ncbi:hypothetical protein GF386_01645 [Candidatus Pacearchaeota archaeon]|nr:hypothetical protein [Candidatus Pacearchaeota archaeon]MBD3282883.1 hypothetical protein [Candidatus Pacearchaeota archaeon]